jgi:NADH:ubiquinone oxidoreductase subunit 5 (subunit L)/multisubunit Na+/H+ antiporter MnhA subunit
MVSYCLVIFYQREYSRNSGMITVLSNRIGDVGILMRIVFIMNFSVWGIFEFCSIYIINFVGLMVILGAITKSAQIPFSA